MLIDTHAHLQDEQFDSDRGEVIARALAAGVERIINIGDNIESSARGVKLAADYPELYAAVGIHPQEAGRMQPSHEELLASWAKLPKVVAIGEIGLDYYYENTSRECQKEVFIRQLDLARQLHLPVCIHDRDAHGDLMAILAKEGKGLAGVIHCFSGSGEMARELVRSGWHIGIDGPLTFKNAAKLPDVVRQVPLERLLIETDSPYLAPVPMRGKRNEPAHVIHVARKAAELRQTSFDEFAAATTKNARNLFGLA